MSEGLWFTRARLNRNAPDVQPLLGELLPADRDRAPNVAHRLLWTLMPRELQVAEREQARAAFLWREGEQDGGFYILGPHPRLDSALLHVETTAWRPALQPGDRLAFDLRVNATIDRKVGAQGHGRRASLRSDLVLDAIRKAESETGASRAAIRRPTAVRALDSWMKTQADRNGFRVEGDCELMAYRTLSLTRRGRQPAPIGVADLRGVLVVQDPVVFAAKVARGFGRAKAFGCGLLLLRRASAGREG